MKAGIVISMILVFSACAGQARHLPPPVSSLNATATSSTSVHVTWSPGHVDGDPDVSTDAYVLGYGTTALPDSYQVRLDSSVSSYDLTNLSPNTEYVISVRGLNTRGMGIATRVTVFTQDSMQTSNPGNAGQVRHLPPPVSNLDATATSSTSVHVTWSPGYADGDSDVSTDAYVLGYGTMTSPDFCQVRLDSSVSSYNLTNLSPHTKYVISVRGLNTRGIGIPTYVTVFTQDSMQTSRPGNAGQARHLPPPVSSLDATATSSNSVHVTWSPGHVDGDPDVSTDAYVLGYGTMALPDSFQIQLDSSVSSYNLTNLSPHTEYVISVRGLNTRGMGIAARVTVFTQDSMQTSRPGNGGHARHLPPPVSNLDATATSSRSVHVTWSPGHADDDPGLSTDAYVLGYGTMTLPDAFQVRLESSVSSYDLTNLSSHTEYVISVRSLNTRGMGIATYVTVFTQDSMQTSQPGNGQARHLPPPVSSLDATATSSTSVHVTWSPGHADGDSDVSADAYVLGYGTMALPDSYQVRLDSTVSSYDLTNLSPNAEYVISVRGLSTTGMGIATYVTVFT